MATLSTQTPVTLTPEQSRYLKKSITATLSAIGEAIRNDRAREQQTTQSEEIIGVGLTLDQDKTTRRLFVVSPLTGMPASRAGILPNDFIVRISGMEGY